MASTSTPSRRTPTGRRRGRPPGTTNAARAARQASLAASSATEPPPKRRRFIPGGSSGGGGLLTPGNLVAPDADGAITVSRSRSSVSRHHGGASPSSSSRRARGARTRANTNDEELFGTAAAVAAGVKQADDYKPREERSWEEFHPSLITEKRLMVFLSEEVDGLPQPPQETSSTSTVQTPGTPLNGSMTPSRQIKPASTGNTPNPQGKSEINPFDAINGTPSRRSRRPTRDVVSFYGTKSMDFAAATPKTPKILPIHSQTSKERLDLKLPSYRKTNRVELFESKTFGHARYVDKAMSNIGYQESDHFIRPERQLIKASDGHMDDEFEVSSAHNEDSVPHSKLGRVEYDMDEQDDMWLAGLNSRRKTSEQEEITREIFEITMTKIEKEWHALEKRIPKPNPKPPQTHRPRSGSAAAVNGEPHSGDEPDSRCAICDDGDCENTNAIVFCDGCDLAVHQECYGVPFIPEGQWLCRKCQSCGRGVPTCIFCPNTDGAFKQTSTSRWAHLLCAMWIPEVSLGNHTFMEPVMEVEKVPRTRWKLQCYICNQRMGACIQCGNKNCYQAFHVTCARRAQLYLKMKTATGALAVLDGSMILKAFCDKHCPPEYAEEHHVAQAIKIAKRFYKKNMRGRMWAETQAIANMMATHHRDTPGQGDEGQHIHVQNSAIVVDKKKGAPQKNVWRLPSGAPVIPQAVFNVVENALQRFPIRKRKEFLGEACRYWTLKREARRGAALLKRLQLQMDSSTSMELTRRNFAAMGPEGRDRLARRIRFAETLVKDLAHLKAIANELVEREKLKLNAAELEQDFVDECYFPLVRLLSSSIEKAISLDKDLFDTGLVKIQSRVEARYYTRTLVFVQDLCDVISEGINNAPSPKNEELNLALSTSPSKNTFSDIRERRKLGKRILKAIQSQLEAALRIEAEILGKPFDTLQKELEAKYSSSLEPQQTPAPSSYHDDENDDSHDTIMVDASIPGQITVKPRTTDGDDDIMNIEVQYNDNIEVKTSEASTVDGDGPMDVDMMDEAHVEAIVANGNHSQTPPGKSSFDASPRLEPNAPPTPPQSNGSQSNGSLEKEPSTNDPLADGGIVWYMKDFQPLGTSAVGDSWALDRDAAMRLLSEDLTDLDDEELKGLGVDVDEAMAATTEEEEDDGEEETEAEKETPRATRAGTAAKREAQAINARRRTSTRKR